MTIFEKFLPMETKGGPNKRLHWSKRARIAKQERECAWLLLLEWRFAPRLPCTITLTRATSATRFLDDDNLRGVLKSIRDGVADRLKIDDGDMRIEWKYGQVRCKRGEFGVFVRFESL
jgi:hypothetical protein